jgi:hypothetical protein
MHALIVSDKGDYETLISSFPRPFMAFFILASVLPTIRLLLARAAYPRLPIARYQPMDS